LHQKYSFEIIYLTLWKLGIGIFFKVEMENSSKLSGDILTKDVGIKRLSLNSSFLPNVVKGDLKLRKAGFFGSSWNDRFFVAEKGRLSCFEKSHWLLDKDYDLTGYSVDESPNSFGENKIVLKNSIDKIILKADKVSDVAKWKCCLKEHCDFASLVSKNPVLLLKLLAKAEGNIYYDYQKTIKLYFN
jgi:hypothetical protein